MKIAIACEDMDLESLVPMTFRESAYLMILDTETNEVTDIYKKRDEENMWFAERTLAHDCEAIICGPMEKEPFEKLALAGVTRYNGTGRKLWKAYEKMQRYQRDWIADYIGGPCAFGHSHSGECEHHHEEEE